MRNWQEKEFDDAEDKMVWDFMYDNFAFNAYNKNQEYIITPPPPCKSFDISDFYEENYSQELCDDLEICMVEWFKIISKGKRMYALNWQHDTYSFDPNLLFERDKFDEWLIPAFPYRDLLCF